MFKKGARLTDGGANATAALIVLQDLSVTRNKLAKYPLLARHLPSHHRHIRKWSANSPSYREATPTQQTRQQRHNPVND